MIRSLCAVALVLPLLWLAGAGRPLASRTPARVHAATPPVGSRILAAARAQVGTLYDPGYYTLAYPNGDVPRGRGACTDVVIRSLRRVGYDLQRLIHEDMKRNLSAYRRRRAIARIDRNIDHRRVPNQITYFSRHGRKVTQDTSPRSRHAWQPGDIVYWKFDNGLDHCGIITDRRGASGLPLVVHNLATCVEEDVLTAWKITGHFRAAEAR